MRVPGRWVRWATSRQRRCHIVAMRRGGRARGTANQKIDKGRGGKGYRSTSWGGDRIHLTETCEDEVPHLIIQVADTPAQVTVGDITPAIQATLATQTCFWASIRLTRPKSMRSCW
jgi:hypothetical protein